MSVDTPGVGARRRLLPDLPGPLRRQRSGAQARRRGALGQPADDPRLQGRRPAGHRRAPALPGRPRGQRHLPDADLPVRLEPSLSHVRLLHGRSAARWRGGPARVAGPRPRAGHAGRARWRVQPHRPRLLAVPSHPGDRRRIALSRLVPPVAVGTRRAALPAALPGAGRGHQRRGAGLPGLVGAAGPAQAQHRPPGGARIPARGGRALAALRHRWLAPGRPGRDPRRGVLAGLPPALPRHPAGRLPGR